MLEFEILGPLLVRGDDGELAVAGARRRALLARLLVSANQSVPAERLVEDVWDSDPPAGASQTLQSHLSFLRKVLGRDRVLHRAGGYTLTVADDELDARLFEAEHHQGRAALSTGDVESAARLLESGLARWRGAALADVNSAEWARPEITRLEEMRLAAIEAWHEALLALGRHHEVAANAEAAVAEHPVREQLWAQLILALYRSGRQTDALRAYQRLRTYLGDELGIEPSHELVALDEAVVLQKPELDWTASIGSEPRLGVVRSDSIRPSGNVTFLFSDIEGSTRLWESAHDAMSMALRRCEELIAAAIDSAEGYLFKSMGDAFCAAFVDARNAAEASVSAQRALQMEQWPDHAALRVRIALHTGGSEERNGDYFGPTLNRTARLMALAHGGQIILSRATAELVRDFLPDGTFLRDMGEHHLRDLSRPEQIFQIDADGLATDFPPLRSRDNPALRHNLPRRLSSFIGRDNELEELSALVRTQRLMTLTGVGGVGKTRLALQVAGEYLDEVRDGVWLVELASLSDPEALARTVAKVLGVSQHTDRPMMESVAAHLHDRNLLLILDNCEHVLAPAARLAAHIAQYSPGVTILTTSRERLGIAGENVVRIPPMTIPPADATELDDVARFDAVRLFCERARSSQPQFAMDSRNCTSVASVCRRLDGIPLAIELAATRLSSLSVMDIDERLDHRFTLLTGGDRAGHARQQTLRATVDWSYELLSPSEQTVFSRLSVIAGRWSLPAALAVCPADGLDSWAVEDAVGSLVDKNLVQAELADDGHHYRLLDTIRSYAAEKLATLGPAEVWAARLHHAEFFTETVEAAAPHLTGPDQNWWVAELERDHDNLRAALTFLSDEGAPTGLALRLATGLRWFWFIRGYYDEGIDFLDRVLARADAEDDPGLRATALLTAGTLHQPRGEYVRAKAVLEECRALADTAGTSGVLADALCELAWLAFQEGDRDAAVDLANGAIDRAKDAEELKLVGFAFSVRGGATFAGDPVAARKDFDEAIRCLETAGDRKRLSGVLCRLAIHELEIGDLDAARIHLQDVRTLAIELDDEGILPFVHSGLGFCALFGSKDNVAARSFFGDALTVACRVDDQASIAYAVLGLAFCATADAHGSAALLHGAADELMSASEQTLEEFETSLRDHDHRELRAQLGSDEFAEAYAAGQRLTAAGAVEIALEYARTADDLRPPRAAPG